MTKKAIGLKLKKLIKYNNCLEDIWIYGTISDRFSDLDLLFLYKNKLQEVSIPNYVKDKIYNGNIIFLPYKLRNKIFLFENLNCYSVKKLKKIYYKIPKKYENFRNQTSFVERYYYTRKLIRSGKINNCGETIRNIKSLIVSYKTFSKFNPMFKKDINLINKQYKIIRAKIGKNKKNESYLNKVIKKIKIFDKNFYKFSISYFDKKFNDIDIQTFNFNFMEKEKFISNEKIKNIPKLYGYIMKNYIQNKNELSNKISKDFKYKISRKSIFKKSYKKLNKYLDIKFKFLNKCYIDLKKSKINNGLYRFNWYLTS